VSRRKLAPGAPSLEAHEALVATVLEAVTRVDPRLLPLIKLEWAPTRSFLGSACVVPAGMAYATGVTYPNSLMYRTDEQRAVFTRFVKRKITWAQASFAQVRISSRLWLACSAEQRAENIAHELAHLSHGLNLLAARGNPYPGKLEAHGSAWQAWVVKYAGRPGPVRLPIALLREEPDLGKVASLPLFVK
jgi:hypothetical protein